MKELRLSWAVANSMIKEKQIYGYVIGVASCTIEHNKSLADFKTLCKWFAEFTAQILSDEISDNTHEDDGIRQMGFTIGDELYRIVSDFDENIITINKVD